VSDRRISDGYRYAYEANSTGFQSELLMIRSVASMPLFESEYSFELHDRLISAATSFHFAFLTRSAVACRLPVYPLGWPMMGVNIFCRTKLKNGWCYKDEILLADWQFLPPYLPFQDPGRMRRNTMLKFESLIDGRGSFSAELQSKCQYIKFEVMNTTGQSRNLRLPWKILNIPDWHR
jgi:hypothetical protein